MPCHSSEAAIDQQLRKLDVWMAGVSAGSLAALGAVVVYFWRR